MLCEDPACTNLFLLYHLLSFGVLLVIAVRVCSVMTILSSKTVGGWCFCSRLFDYEPCMHELCSTSYRGWYVQQPSSPVSELCQFCTWTMEPLAIYNNQIMWWSLLRLAPIYMPRPCIYTDTKQNKLCNYIYK